MTAIIHSFIHRIRSTAKSPRLFVPHAYKAAQIALQILSNMLALLSAEIWATPFRSTFTATGHTTRHSHRELNVTWLCAVNRPFS